MINSYFYFFISIFVHEIAHISVAKLVKIRLKNIKINIFGVSLENNTRIKENKYLNILMYLSGPIANIIFVIVMYKLLRFRNYKMIYTNLIIAIFNLLPIIPLDGGNILREILKLKFNLIRAHRISISVSKICLSFLTFAYSILILKIKNISIFLVIIYLWYLEFNEEKKLELLEKTYKILQKNIKNLSLEKHEKMLK